MAAKKLRMNDHPFYVVLCALLRGHKMSALTVADVGCMVLHCSIENQEKDIQHSNNLQRKERLRRLLQREQLQNEAELNSLGLALTKERP